MMLSLYNLFFILTTFTFCKALMDNVSIGLRIIGGKEASIMDAPFMASLQRDRGSSYTTHVCGAVIVTKTYLLTAAHCLVDKQGSQVQYYMKSPKKYMISSGSKYAEFGTITKIYQFFVHEDFDASELSNDFGAIELSNDLLYDRNTQPAKLPEGNISETSVFLKELEEVRTECKAFGWGVTTARSYTNDLRVVGLHLVKADVCRKVLEDRKMGLFYESNQLCTLEDREEKDACQGDSGGPLSCNGVVWGLVSWGKGCARLGNPSVFARADIAKFWLEKIIANNSISSRKMDDKKKGNGFIVLSPKTIVLILNTCFILCVSYYLSK